MAQASRSPATDVRSRGLGLHRLGIRQGRLRLWQSDGRGRASRLGQCVLRRVELLLGLEHLVRVREPVPIPVHCELDTHRVARRPSVFAAGAGSGVASLLLALTTLLPATAVAEVPARKDVLLLYADSMLLPANVVADRELRSVLGADASTPVRFYTEALDLSWFPDKEVERAMLDLLRAKYADRNLALVIPV